MVSTIEFYQRAILDYDGVIRQYRYQKKQSNSGLWGESRSSIVLGAFKHLHDRSSELRCGLWIQKLLQLDGDKPHCLCPTIYIHLDIYNTFGGCKTDFDPESCGKYGDQFVMEQMINTDWPLSDFKHYISMDEDQFRETCLGDCLCAVAIFRGGDCWKKKLPLSSGRMDSTVEGKALIKVRKIDSNSPLTPPSPSGRKKEHVTGPHYIHAFRQLWVP